MPCVPTLPISDSSVDQVFKHASFRSQVSGDQINVVSRRLHGIDFIAA
jgi:hypothetical protein